MLIEEAGWDDSWGSILVKQYLILNEQQRPVGQIRKQKYVGWVMSFDSYVAMYDTDLEKLSKFMTDLQKGKLPVCSN